MATRDRNRSRNVLTAAVAAVVFVVPFLVTNVGSAAITQPVSVVTSVDGVAGATATVGKPATVAFTITNKATNGAKLGLFTIVVPRGVSGIARAGISSSTWNELILPCGATPRCSALVFASATRSSGFLPPGASVTVSIRLTPNAAGTLAFPLLGIGNGLFTATSTPTVTVVPASTATGLRITSITEAGSPLSILHAGQTFQVAFEVIDAGGNVVTSPDVTVSLSALNLGPLGSLTSAPVTTSNGKGVISATYVGPNVTGLMLQLTAGSLTSDPASVNLVAGDLSVSLTPGQNITITIGDITLSTGTGTALLRNGAYGKVNFSIGQCVPDETTTCEGVISEISLFGDFGGSENEPLLYSNDAPAELDWGCNPDTCKPPGFDPDNTTLGELQAAEYANHPIAVAPSSPGGRLQPFTPAPACSGVTTPLVTGRIVEPDAQKLGFCVDEGAISRSVEQCDKVCSAWSGNLTMPVLFVNDPRFTFG